jgi:hypothetical protein
MVEALKEKPLAGLFLASTTAVMFFFSLKEEPRGGVENT